MDNHFRKFCETLEVVLAEHDAGYNPDEELLVRQRKQLRNLIALETEFRDTLIRHAWGPKVYSDFVYFITHTRRNILAARPYFRERHAVFTRHISKALKEKNDKALYRVRFNWSFVEWVLSARKWRAGSKIVALANDIKKQRMDLLEQNLPLAISQARLFWNSTPRSHLTYMDIVQIQCQGLLLAIDKFVPPNDKRMSEKASLARYRTFRAVAIGIMTRDRVNAYSETLVHFYPKDRLKRYQANKLLRRQIGAEPDYDALAVEVTKNLDDPTITTTGSEVQSLLAAGSTISGDYSLDPDGETVMESFAADSETRPDLLVEQQEVVSVLHGAIGELNLREQKLLRMKGIK